MSIKVTFVRTTARRQESVAKKSSLYCIINNVTFWRTYNYTAAHTYITIYKIGKY